MARPRKEHSKPYEWLEYDSRLRRSCSFYTQSFTNPPWPFRWHYHADHYEILLHLENPGHYLIGNTAGDLYEGDLFVLGPGLAHSFYHAFDNQRITRCNTVRFPTECFREWLEGIPELSFCRTLAERATTGIRFPAVRCSPARSLIAGLVAFRNRPSLKAFSLFVELLGVLAECKGAPICNKTQLYSRQNETDERLDLICGYLIENILRQPTLTEIAELAHMSVANLCVFFRKKTGRTVIQYINELRISRACELLRNSDLPILDVAFESGYANLSHFNRQFLRCKKQSPRDYRKSAAAKPIK